VNQHASRNASDDRVTLSVPIALADDSGAPLTEFRLFRAGQNATSKGVFLFDAQAAADTVAAFADQGNDLPLDYDHAMADPFSGPRDRVAAGWFKLDVRNGELWAVDVRYTPQAAKALADREWRYTSPYFLTSGEAPNRRITRVINAALTNLPATKNLTPIAASMTDEPATADALETPPMKTLLVALGLGADASEAEALSALQKHEGERQRLFALTGKSTLGEAEAQVIAWKIGAENGAKAEEALSAFKKTQVDAEANGLIDAAVKDGKLPPADKATVLSQYQAHGIDVLKFALSLLKPVVNTTQSPAPLVPVGEGSAATLSAEDKSIARMLGLTEAQALANKKISLGGAA
jgi:phage I-like protein